MTSAVSLLLPRPTGSAIAVALLSIVLLTACNQYSTPSVQPSATTPGTAAPLAAGADARSANPLDDQSSPSETTGSVGGSPGGTSSAQTVPSSSNGIR